jgi:hypothetical protein
MLRAMRLSRAITLLAAGAAAAWAAERQRRATAHAVLPEPPPEPPGPAPPEPGERVAPEEPGLGEAEAEPAPEPPEPPEPEPPSAEPLVSSEQPTLEESVVEEPDPIDVNAVVEDLIAPLESEAVVDAEVVEEPEPAGPPSDELVAASVRRALARDPRIPAGAVTVEAAAGQVFLRGEIDSPGLIGELERRVQEIEGVDRVRNLLHLPGTPPPS